MKYKFIVAFICCYMPYCCLCQTRKDTILIFPARLIRDLNAQQLYLSNVVTSASTLSLRRFLKDDQAIADKIGQKDSTSKRLLELTDGPRYKALLHTTAINMADSTLSVRGEYRPYVDSIRCMLTYLQQEKYFSASQLTQLKEASLKFNSLQSTFCKAESINEFMLQGRLQVQTYIQTHPTLAGLLDKNYQKLSQNCYYYEQELKEYKAKLNTPDKIEQQALSLLEKLPAFQQFMQTHGQLAGLFGISANYGTPQGLAGLQTRDQIASMIQGQVSAAGPGGAAALQSSLQSGESQLDAYKDKLSQLGAGSGDMQMTDFKYNPMKTKTFWKRLQYGANFQTTRNSYLFPTVADFGAQVGFRLSGNNVVGLGASYKLGLGNGFQHIAFSNEGVGLRSFLNIKIKGSISLSGGYEMNYTTPFSAYQDLYTQSNWTKSGLIGVMKTVAVKNRFFKQTSLQLLWDFLSYQQVPRTQPIIFRVGYTF